MLLVPNRDDCVRGLCLHVLHVRSTRQGWTDFPVTAHVLHNLGSFDVVPHDKSGTEIGGNKRP
jgi:hypothetical protein